jgi:N-acetylglutamate synthase-like GNAT family acetyltransferase
MKFKFITPSDPYYKDEQMLRWEVLKKPQGIPPQYIDVMQENKSFHLIAIENKQIVGCVLCHQQGLAEGKIYDLVLDNPYDLPTEKGFGRKMLHRLEDFLQQKGLEHIYVLAKKEETDFFSQMGYKFEDEPFEEYGITYTKMGKKLLLSA